MKYLMSRKSMKELSKVKSSRIRSANVARIVIEKLKLIEDAEFAGPPTFRKSCSAPGLPIK